MATKHQITQEILDARNTAQDVVRRKYLRELSVYTGRDTQRNKENRKRSLKETMLNRLVYT